MLLGPTMDTFEARADCRANKLTLTRGRGRAVQDRPCTLLHGPIGRFLYRPPTERCYDKPIKATTRRVYKFSKKMNSFAAEISILSFHVASREDLSNLLFTLMSKSSFTQTVIKGLQICLHR